MNELVDTTEMYLRTVYELEEEGIIPLRARIAERLKQSGPTVSQTVARMERDGLLTVQDDRHLVLTDVGLSKATAVMRKHRLAELLLTDVIGLPWEDVHVEACRWEHVMSEEVERKLIVLLDHPRQCPHGNPIPGLAGLEADDGGRRSNRPDPDDGPDAGEELVTLLVGASAPGDSHVVVRRISEQLQPDPAAMHRLLVAGLRPGSSVVARPAVEGGVQVRADGGSETAVDEITAAHIFVTAG